MSGRLDALRVVARREFVERARDRSFAISTGVTLLILVGFILANAFFNRGTHYDVGIVGPGSAAVGAAAVDVGRAQGAGVTLHAYARSGGAQAALGRGDLDAVVEGGATILVKSSPPTDLVNILQSASAQARVRAAVSRLGLSPAEAARVLEPRPLPVRSLQPPRPHRQSSVTVAFVGVLLLYGQLFGYGVAVASGVVEEKSSRVIELLLSAIRPRQLLTGKILGIGALGFLQLLGVGIVGIVTAKLSGGFTFPPGSAGIVVTVLAFFVLGFAFYSSLFAVAGSMVPRQEELQNSMTPLSLVIVISFFVSIAALNNPDSTSAVIASLLPPSAPLAMPIRVAQGAAPVWQIVASVLISIATTAALVPVAGRLYSAAILRTGGRVRIREAWRAASAERVPR